MESRLVLTNANVITMAGEGFAEALAVENDRILRVGPAASVRDLLEAGWPETDLAGKTVLPGFIDTHQHLMLSGLQATAAQLQEAKSLDEVFQALAEVRDRSPKGAWVRGANLNELHLKEKRMPTAEELEKVSPDHPVYVLHATCHMCSFNSRGLDLVRPPLDLEGLDLEGGKPTGVVRDPGILTFVMPAMGQAIEDETRKKAVDVAADLALRRGLTTVHALDGGDLGPGDTRFICREKDRLPIRLVCYNQSMDLAEVRELGLPRVGGCICADGAFEAHTAAMFEPYADQPENYGALTYSQEVMDKFILEAHRAGLQISVHAEADRSIEQVLSAMEKAIRAFPREDHRHRIEHLELPTWNQLARMVRAGITASMQPAFIPAFIGSDRMEIYEELLGKPRLDRVHPYRTILDSGLTICGGSDSPVTPYHPLAGVEAAVRHPNPRQRVSRREALAMFTSAAAWSAFEEKEKGTLEEGKLADLVVLDQDPLTVLEEDISRIGVEMVFVGGKRLV